MSISSGQIVKNLIPSEPVIINQIQDLGRMISLAYTGVNSNVSSNKVISRDEFERLEVLTSQGVFNFTGDPRNFSLFAEAERIDSAYQFDPLFAVNCSIVDPLPHQVEAVYKYLLPLPKIRFLLADDTGAGKTIMTGLLLKELMMRGLIERILIITPGGLTKQWQEDELGVKFNIPFTLVNRSLFTYSTLLKFSVKKGIDLITVKQFRETIDGQINYNVVSALKDEEWLLDSIGFGTLKNNNLLPTVETAVKAKDIFEAFLRYDDKPMITDSEAVRKSLIKYCYEGAFCIASGDGKVFTKYYLKENVPFLDVNDPNYWLVDKSLKPTEIKPTIDSTAITTSEPEKKDNADSDDSPTREVKEFSSITISGSVPLERYSELFNYFITPFAMRGNKIDIQVSFKISANENSPLTESTQQYKSAKEAAKQLKLEFFEDPSE